MNSKEAEGLYKAVKNYVKSIKTGDEEWFNKAFYPDAVIINANEEDPKKATTSLKDFISNIQTLHKDGVSTEEIPLGTSVSYVGSVANVRLDFELKIGDQTLYGTDYFNMVKWSDKWKISQKIYYVTHTK